MNKKKSNEKQKSLQADGSLQVSIPEEVKEAEGNVSRSEQYDMDTNDILHSINTSDRNDCDCNITKLKKKIDDLLAKNKELEADLKLMTDKYNEVIRNQTLYLGKTR